jgi:endonuclease/exonuclease/phosphatase family metal-dependent hydrolase
MTQLRVATYNVHHGVGVDGALDLKRTAATINQTGADLIALQELDRNVERSGGIDQPARLEDLTGMRIRFFPTIRFGGGEFGLAIAARDPVDLEFHLLPKTRFDRPHGVILTRARGIGVVATHLSRRLFSRALETASVSWTCRHLDPPKLLLGDLNTTKLAFVPMRLAGLQRQTPFRPTFTSLDPRRQIDHVVTSRGLRLIDCWTIRSAASDHLALVAEVEVERLVEYRGGLIPGARRVRASRTQAHG